MQEEVVSLKNHSQNLVNANQTLSVELESFMQANDQAIARQESHFARYEKLKSNFVAQSFVHDESFRKAIPTQTHHVPNIPRNVYRES
jgi:hypothetical protein